MTKSICLCAAMLCCVMAVPAPGADAANTEALAPIRTPPFGVQTRWPFYKPTKYLHIKEYDMHILGTVSVTDWMMRESCTLVRNMVSALKRPEDRAQFAGHQTYLITDADPALPGSRQGHRNTGGKGFSLFNEALVCRAATDTIRPDMKPVFRAWNTPVHEFGHAIEHTLGLEARSDALYKRHAKHYNPDVAREYFAWATQQWFASTRNGSGRETLPGWHAEYLASIFAVSKRWVPKCPDDRPPLLALAQGNSALKTEISEEPLRATQLEDLPGEYRRSPAQNDWHAGVITIEKRDDANTPTELRWTNRAGRSWPLFPAADGPHLRTGKENPYYRSNRPAAQEFRIAFDTQESRDPPRPAGFWFQHGLFVKQ